MDQGQLIDPAQPFLWSGAPALTSKKKTKQIGPFRKFEKLYNWLWQDSFSQKKHAWTEHKKQFYVARKTLAIFLRSY